MAELKEEMSEGKISFEMVREALNLATQEGGKFYKGAERGSKTLEGLLSTAVDNFSIAMGDAFRNNEDAFKGGIMMHCALALDYLNDPLF